MSRKKLIIESLTDTEKVTLDHGMKYSKSLEFRPRCHAVLLSFSGFEVKQLAEIFSVGENTIRTWLNNWKKHGISGLISKPGRGRKPILSINNLEQSQVVEKAVENTALNGTNMLDEVNKELDLEKPISKWTLNRFLVKKNYCYKRFRKWTKKEPKISEVKKVISIMKQLLELVKHGLIDIYFSDESGFTMTPKIAYGWQPIGEQWGIPAYKKKVQNVVGFLNPFNHNLVVNILPEKAYMNSKFFIQYVNDFATKITKPTILVVDRAPWHVSAETFGMLETWQQQELHLLFLPAYCPHLNLIETLWRKIKYEWLSFQDYRNPSTLKKKLISIFQEYGNQYQINFSMNIFQS